MVGASDGNAAVSEEFRSEPRENELGLNERASHDPWRGLRRCLSPMVLNKR